MIPEFYEGHFKDKQVTVMGLGLLGRGIGDTAFLAKCGANLTVTDTKTQEELATSLASLAQFPDIIYHLGEHTLTDFQKKDFILKAAGVPYDSEFIAHAHELEIPVYMSAALVSQIILKANIGVTIIGVTGTRGKSTVTQMVAHVLASSGMRVFLGGNVRGVANLPLLEALEEGDYLVLELDSWQLQGFGDLKISPNIAVFTSFMDDHMNYYKNDKELYFNDKANVYRHQTEYDVLIASAQAASEILMREKVAILVPEKNVFETKLIGEHNQVAARLTYEVCSQCGLEDEEIRQAIASFAPVEGRLQDLGIFGVEKNIQVFNDNNATTGDAVIAAIEAINQTYTKKPFLIIGGTDKGLPLTSLEQMLLIGVKDTIFLAGTGTDKINLPQDKKFTTLTECVDKVFDLAQDGDIILFSPGFASFSEYFHNEYERNDAFIKAVEKYRQG
jgi:UDP-N-acetylmuramoylalanine--D-glutamate ligase